MFKRHFLFLIAFNLIALPSAFARRGFQSAACKAQPASMDCYKARLKQYRESHGVSDDQCSKHPGLRGCTMPRQKKVQQTQRQKSYSSLNHTPLCKRAIIRTQQEAFLSSPTDKKIRNCISKLNRKDFANYISLNRKQKIDRKSKLENTLSKSIEKCLGKRYECRPRKAFSSLDRFNSCRKVSRKVVSVSRAVFTRTLNENCHILEDLDPDNWTNAWGILK